MLPTQILLNNLLYDASEMTIPTDNVDEEQLQRPAHWDTALHPPLHDLLRADQLDLRLRHLRDHDLGLRRRRPAVPLRLVRRVARDPEPGHLRDPHPPRPVLPQPARARRSSSPPSPAWPIGVALPFSPLADVLGFTALPAGFLAVLAAMIVVYLRARSSSASGASTGCRRTGHRSPALARTSAGSTTARRAGASEAPFIASRPAVIPGGRSQRRDGTANISAIP